MLQALGWSIRDAGTTNSVAVIGTSQHAGKTTLVNAVVLADALLQSTAQQQQELQATAGDELECVKDLAARGYQAR